jgi:hypothetical protein
VTALRLAVAIRSGHLEIVRSTGSTRAETQRLDRDEEASTHARAGAGVTDGAVAASEDG